MESTIATSRRDRATQGSKGTVGIGRWLLRIVAFGYPLALLAVVIAFRFIGERFWMSTAALYLPRLGFALPLPFITLWILLARAHRLLLTQLVAALLIVFPLMGLSLSTSSKPTGGAFQFRVLSFNIDADAFGADAILRPILKANADLILLQEARSAVSAPFRAALPGYFFHENDQFFVASRFPISNVFAPPPIQHDGHHRSPRFMGYDLLTPAGTIRLYNVHPISPHDALDELRGAGLREEMASGRLLQGRAAAQIDSNARLRMAQLQEIVADAERSVHPVLIAGDTNLPGLSWALHHWLGDYQDGFSATGAGFGYTFPATKRPWMRIDRILTKGRFRFLRFEVLRDRASDHRAVVSDIELAPAL